MDQVTGNPYHRNGVVWLDVSVNARQFELGAARPGEWNVCMGLPTEDDLDTGKRLAVDRERAHSAAFAALFAEAAAWRKAKP